MYKVVYEIEVDAESPLDAAKEVQSIFRDMYLKGNNGQYYVQNEGDIKIWSVDLEEDDEDAVLSAYEYTPLIKTFGK